MTKGKSPILGVSSLVFRLLLDRCLNRKKFCIKTHVLLNEIVVVILFFDYLLQFCILLEDCFHFLWINVIVCDLLIFTSK